MTKDIQELFIGVHEIPEDMAGLIKELARMRLDHLTEEDGYHLVSMLQIEHIAREYLRFGDQYIQAELEKERCRDD